MQNIVDSSAEYDSSFDAYSYYRTLYRGIAPFTFYDLRNLQWASPRYIARLKPDCGKTEEYGPHSAVAGECILNFNQKKGNRFSAFANTPALRAQLARCTAAHHTPSNLCLFPRSGGLNNLKGQLCVNGNGQIARSARCSLDRPDTFLCALNRFYRCGEEMVLAVSTRENRECLRAWLRDFDDVYDFSRRVYRIDRRLTDRMLENGLRGIGSPAALKAYMDIAEQFWAQRDLLLTDSMLQSA